MALADVARNDEDGAEQLLIEADRLLHTKATEAAPGFASALYSRASAEDLEVYQAKELAALAATAWDFLQQRDSAAAQVRLANPEPKAPGLRIGAVSVLDVINDDMPFLLDSVLAELNEQGAQVLLVTHPTFSVARDQNGRLTAFHPPAASGSSVPESFISIHIARIEDAARRDTIAERVRETLRAVRQAVVDWKAMLARVRALIAEMRETPPAVSVDEVAEAIHFLEWLAADNFTFLGIREYSLPGNADDVVPNHETGLGILRDPAVHVLKRGNELLSMTPEIRAFLSEPRALIVAKANVRSRVHRRAYMDYIGVKRFDAKGTLVGEFRIVGLFTSTAYTRAARGIPYLRRKVDAVFRRAGFDEKSHSGKALVNVLETYPRDDLFQIDEDTLFSFALAIMQLDERPRVRVLSRRDKFDRFVSVLVFVPRERYDSTKRVEIGDYLAGIYDGHVSAFYPFFPDGPLVRVHFIIGRSGGATPNPSRETLEEGVEDIVRTWTDDLTRALTASHPPALAELLAARYAEAFTDGYRESYSPDIGVADVARIEELGPARRFDLAFHMRSPASGLGLKVWCIGRPVPLSERVPVLENMGFRVVDERTFRITPGNAEQVWLHDMLIEPADGGSVDLDATGARLETAMRAILSGEAESDGFNALTLLASLDWREVALMRTIGRYLRQARIAYSQDYLWTTLRRYPDIATSITQLFISRFEPTQNVSREAREEALVAKIEAQLEAVQNLDEDTMLRRYLNVVQSTLRTNFFQHTADGATAQTLSLKLDSRKLTDLPAPRPLYEIFVYSPRVEGVHLRFGKVARGGIRWSDRPQDFRTEILGLVKAQQVKNAVIVPVGAKGGFVPKHIPANAPREVVQAEGVAAYKIFISSLLDLTDNIGPHGIVPPRDVVRHDGDDPYFVVAADKGTATFSDIANAISVERGFWLGDAFASGGSAGYDHKKMGITARGAWEAVKRHFRELDTDIGVTPFTVTGVGDMSGDVFGNGMLREHTIKLVAAFDHRDIFIDPEPDPAASFAERQRLFDLPRSSWQDYDKALISPGGGIYSRNAKEIALSPQARALLGLTTTEKATPRQVMHAILTMRSDLLWFGGIGTYVRASTETDEAAGDRANDAIRATAADLKCRVIGEGANLGMTQRGRIEAGLRGIRLNTDAIDNSAGVNTSDVEVNIKIALSPPVRDGRLTLDSRNTLLAAMTDEVAALVLRNNYLQTLAISLTELRGLEDLGFQQCLMQTLGKAGELDRKVEFLPDEIEIAERRRQGKALTRPEISVLLAYAKLSLYGDLLESSVPDDAYLGRELGRYFPQRLSAEFALDLQQHRLRREIIATHLANSIINRGGPSFVVRIADQTGASAERIALAFTAVRDSYQMTGLNAAIDALDTKISGAEQLNLYLSVQNLLLDRVVWFLRHVDVTLGLASVVEHYREGISGIEASLNSVLPEVTRQALERDTANLEKRDVPNPLARRIANLRVLSSATDIVLIADRVQRPVQDVAATYFAMGAFLAMDRLRDMANTLVLTDYFDRLALDRALGTIADAERRIAAEMVETGDAGESAVQAWAAPRANDIARIRSAIADITAGVLTPSRVTVAANLIADLVNK